MKIRFIPNGLLESGKSYFGIYIEKEMPCLPPKGTNIFFDSDELIDLSDKAINYIKTEQEDWEILFDLVQCWVYGESTIEDNITFEDMFTVVGYDYIFYERSENCFYVELGD